MAAKKTKKSSPKTGRPTQRRPVDKYLSGPRMVWVPAGSRVIIEDPVIIGPVGVRPPETVLQSWSLSDWAAALEAPEEILPGLPPVEPVEPVVETPAEPVPAPSRFAEPIDLEILPGSKQRTEKEDSAKEFRDFADSITMEGGGVGRSIDTPHYRVRSPDGIARMGAAALSQSEALNDLNWEAKELRLWVTFSKERPDRIVTVKEDEHKRGVRSAPTHNERRGTSEVRDFIGEILGTEFPEFGWAEFAGRIEGRLIIPIVDGNHFDALLEAQEKLTAIRDTLGSEWDYGDFDLWGSLETGFDGFDEEYYPES
jgi:hypothetical protein